ncbi:MAG: SCO1664 family protein, partial [Ilumatobacteraceae bacterium]
RGVAVFDLLANNTDRKSGHVLIDDEDHIWGIDHGLCFSADFKLRTVVWEFGGERIDAALIDAVRRIVDRVPLEIATLLADDEVAAMQKRAEWLIDNPVFPVDQSGRRYPWPMV